MVLLWQWLPGHVLRGVSLPLLPIRLLLLLLLLVVLLRGGHRLRLLLVGRLHGRLLALLLLVLRLQRLHGRRHILVLRRLRLVLLQAGDVGYPEAQRAARRGHQHLARGELRGVCGNGRSGGQAAGDHAAAQPWQAARHKGSPQRCDASTLVCLVSGVGAP